MKRPLQLAVLIVAALAFSAPLARAAAGTLTVKPASKLWLVGQSTIHEYESETSQLKVVFEQDAARWPDGENGSQAVESLIRRNGVTAMDLVVGVKSLHSGKDGLDRNMYKALLAEKHPEIRFRMAGYQIAKGDSSGAMKIDARGTLTVAGVEREIRIAVSALREGDAVRMRGEVPLFMTQFGIKPPSMMMGAIKTADQVVIHFDLLIGSKDAIVPMSKVE